MTDILYMYVGICNISSCHSQVRWYTCGENRAGQYTVNRKLSISAFVKWGLEQRCHSQLLSHQNRQSLVSFNRHICKISICLSHTKLSSHICISSQNCKHIMMEVGLELGRFAPLSTSICTSATDDFLFLCGFGDRETVTPNPGHINGLPSNPI